jgi:hypothetical protein
MFVCEELRTETWRPNFSGSGQDDPTWTRVLCRNFVITNSLEWVLWRKNPVLVVLCEACGDAGCASGGIVHVSRLDRHVLWSAPQDDRVDHAAGFLRSRGALAIPIETWNGWPVPRAEQLVIANHAAVADAWVLGAGRAPASIVALLKERLVGGDTLEKDAAIALVERVLAGCQAKADAPFEQPLLSIADAGARIETLYFDGPRELDWPAFAFAGGTMYLALDGQRAACYDADRWS